MIECLLVDDDALILETTKDFLEIDKEIRVTVAHSARDALGMLEGKRYDAVVSDYQMPVMDGIQFLKAVRLKNAETPFILFTGKGREEIVIQAFECGADFYVQKGGEVLSQFAELRHKVKAAVLRRAAEAAAREQRTRLEALIDVADRSIFSVDREYRYTAFNSRHKQTMKQMYGVDVELGKCILDYQSVGDDRAKAKANLDKALAGKRHTAAEFSGEAGRSRFEIEVSHMPIHGPDGDVVGVAVYSDRIMDRTEMEKDLAESRRRYEAIFSAYNEGVALHEMVYDEGGNAVDYRLVECNPALERLLQVRKEDVLGKLATELYARSAGQYLGAFSRTAETGKPTSFEIFVPTVGRHFVVSVSSPGKGQFATVFMDVTERKRAEEEMRKSVEKYRSVTENAAEGLIVAQDRQIKFLNPALAKMLQLEPEQAVGRDFVQFIHPDDRQMVADRYRRRIAGEEVPRQYDFRVLGAKGKVTWVSISAVIINWEGRPATLNFLVDVTERKRAEVELRKLERAVEHSPASIVITDAQGNIEWANPKFTEVTGYSLEEAKGNNPRILKTGETSQEEYAALWQKISSGETWRGEFHNRKKNGDLYWEAASISPIMDPGGGVTNYIAIKEDITDRKMLEDSLAQASKKLAILNSITRHDVLNSVLVIDGSATLLENHAKDPSASIDRIHRSAETIKQQMAFAKLYQDIGAQAPAWQSVRACVMKAKGSLDGKGLDIRMVGKDYEVRADPMFEKVIFNLFDNAVRHASGASRVVLTAHEAKGELVIEVEDDGAGISGDDREHLFERGYGKNTGYGLFLSREILGITGIEIEERSHPGKGARFVITVPALDWRTSK